MSTLLPIIDAGLPVGVIPRFDERLATLGKRLHRSQLSELQINLGKLCNQTCTHCHVEAGPTKKLENMNAATAQRIIELSKNCSSIKTVDLTGGAPEMNPNFRDLVTEFRRRGLRVIDRCNLTILTEPGFQWVAAFLAEQGVDVVASLPCYLEENVDAQRGRGVFDRSIEGLQTLNKLGYGDPTLGRTLDLVYNPTGPSLPPDQSKLESDYKRELWDKYQIRFNRLLAITNIPIKRYANYLNKAGRLVTYMKLLESNFNESAVDHVMCRSLISIGWDGKIFDCDFNQMLEMPMQDQQSEGNPTIWNIDSLTQFIDSRITTADHCYGCTAGAGSSCGGSIITQ